MKEPSFDLRRTLTTRFFEQEDPHSPFGKASPKINPKEEVVEEQKRLINGDIRALVIAYLMSNIITRMPQRPLNKSICTIFGLK